MQNNPNEQMSLEMLEREIQAELNTPDILPPDGSNTIPDGSGEEPQNAQQTQISGAENASRKPFRITDFNSPRDKEMAVFTHAKKLSEYIFVITEKSPKKLRWSIVTRLQNASVELVENLYRANFEREETARLNFQKSAAVSLRLVDFYAETARKKQAITIRQTAIIARQLAETEKLLNGWVRSTKRR